MVVDTSAIIAILQLEPDANDFLYEIINADECLISAVSVLEASMVLAGPRQASAIWSPLDELLRQSDIDVIAFDRQQAYLARGAFLRFGKGRHPAALNLGDCAAYALAISRNLPLLFKGTDFAKTDIVPVRKNPSVH
jgi:ribonuclease VapC